MPELADLINNGQALGETAPGVFGGLDVLTETEASGTYVSAYVAATEAELRAVIALAVADGSHHKTVFISPGLITVDAVIDIGTAESPDMWDIVGSGHAATNLRGTSASGHVFNVLGREVHFRDLTISADATRTAGASGNGINASNAGAGTQSRLLLERVRVMSQPGNGLYCDDPELHKYTDCDFTANKGDGIRWIKDTLAVFSNTMISVRSNSNLGKGLHAAEDHYSTFVDCQFLSNGSTAQVLIAGGRGDTFINADVENQAKAADIANSGYGIQLAGKAHRVISGHFSSLTHGVVLTIAEGCVVDRPYFTGESGNVPMTAGVLVEATSTDCTIRLRSSYLSVTNPYVNLAPTTRIETDGVDVGPDALGLVTTADFGVALISSQTIGTANRCMYARVLAGGRISKVGLQIGVSSGNISVGVYRNSGVGRAAVPATRLATSGAVACPAAGWQEVSLGATIEVRKGDWLALSCDGITATFAAASTATPAASTLMAGRAAFEAAGHPCPTTPTPTAGHTRNILLAGVP